MIKEEEEKEQELQKLVEFLRKNPYEITLIVRKHPRGIQIVWEVSEEEMNYLTKKGLI